MGAAITFELARRGHEVIMAAGFSGHGHKFTPVVGEIVADLVAGGHSDFDLNNFDPGRLLQKH